MKKTTAYARKRKNTGPIVDGMAWANAINGVRPYDEPAHTLWDTSAAADKAEVIVRTALQSLLDCTAPDDPERAYDLLAHALGVTVIRALQIQPHDNPMLPILQAGNHAAERSIERYEATGAWGLDGPGRADLMDAIDLYARVLHMSSPAQMTKATAERMRILRGKARPPTHWAKEVMAAINHSPRP